MLPVTSCRDVIWCVVIFILALDSQDLEGTRDEARGLADKCLLQDVGGRGYRVHDLLLEYVRIKIKADNEMASRAVERQARYLRRLDVVKGFHSPEHGAGNQGLFVLATLWRSIEELSGNPELQAALYSASLSELEALDASADVAAYFCIGNLLQRQVIFARGCPVMSTFRNLISALYLSV